MSSSNLLSADNSSGEYIAQLAVPLPTAEGAHIILQALQVDDALPGTSRRFYVLPEARHVLCVTIKSVNPRSLRMSLHSIEEQIDLACRTMQAFASTAVHSEASNPAGTSPVHRPLGKGLPPPVTGLSL